MPILPFGAYRPDVSDYESANTADILNAVPQGDGYGPFADLSAITQALSAPCRGAFYARKSDGTVAIFAGTSTKLWLLDNTTYAWTDVSVGAGTYTTLASDANWTFAQFNNYVFATQGNDDLQRFELGVSSAFADAPGSPPRARYISVVNRFLVLSGLTSSPYRIQWCDVDDTTNWSTGLADFQDLADGGIVRGVAGGENGTIFQDAAIRRMSFQPGSAVIFGIDRIAVDDGVFAPYSIVNAGDRLFFLSPQGFKMLLPGGYPIPIGKEKVDHTFFADVDQNNLQLIIGSSDPSHTRVMFAYKSLSGAINTFDKILAYDYMLDRWAPLMQTGEYLTSLTRPGLTLEQMDSAYGTNIDTIVLNSMDDISIGSYAKLAGFNSDHKLGFFDGSAKEAILETGEHGGDGRRVFVRRYRPVTDAQTVYGSVSRRERLNTTAGYSSETLINSIGEINARVSTRYARGKIRIPAGEEWTFAAGLEPDVVLEGQK